MFATIFISLSQLHQTIGRCFVIFLYFYLQLSGRKKGISMGSPFLNVLVLYGHCSNSFIPPHPPLSNGQTWKKSAPNHPGKPLHPQATWKKSAPNHPSKPLHPSTPLTGNAHMPICPYAHYAHMETTHFKKGLPYAT